MSNIPKKAHVYQWNISIKFEMNHHARQLLQRVWRDSIIALIFMAL